eukprot:scaffold35578_cov26-Tisochrysis_lutea.AAC.2
MPRRLGAQRPPSPGGQPRVPEQRRRTCARPTDEKIKRGVRPFPSWGSPEERDLLLRSRRCSSAHSCVVRSPWGKQRRNDGASGPPALFFILLGRSTSSRGGVRTYCRRTSC